MKHRYATSFRCLVFILMIFSLTQVFPAFGEESPNESLLEEESTKETVRPIPHPPLGNLEEVIRQQLKEGRKTMERLVVNPEANMKAKALAYGNLGHLYHAYEFTDAAEACYFNAALLHPTVYRWHYCLAYTLQEKGDFQKALASYKTARAIDVTSDLLYLVNIRIGDCYKGLNLIEDAAYAYELAYLIYPEGATILARLGEISLAKKQYKNAIDYLTKALETEPAANKLHYPLAMAYRFSENMKLAKAHLARRGKVGIQPPDPLDKKLKSLMKGYRVHVLSGKEAFAAKRYEEAAVEFEKAVAADPQKAGARIDLGTTYVYLNRIDKGLESYEKAIELAPGNMTAQYNVGDLSLFLGNPKKAITHLETFIANQPNDAVAHLKLATAYRNDTQPDNAIRHYKRTIEIDRSMAQAWRDLSTLLSAGAYHHEAIQILEDAHKTLPHNKDIRHDLARYLAMSPRKDLRDGKRAQLLAQPLVKENPNYETAKTMAAAYAEQNQCDKAVEWMERSIGLAKKSSQPDPVLQTLNRNYEYFKSTKPCRIP